ncbi:MAG: phosphate acyltransferase [Planctomycetes bacterium]|nr:phosphate acyltransferase [Planctomycetota bacterium]
MLRIALDGLGGESVASESAKALPAYLEERKDVSVLLATDEANFASLLGSLSPSAGKRLHWLEAPEKILDDEQPVRALKRKPRSSIRVAVEALAAGKADALVSFGHTGATTAAAQLYLGNLPGVERAGIAVLLPGRPRGCLLMDVGANADCKPIHLQHYALLAETYCQSALKIDSPRIGLLNLGQEAGKGDAILKRAFDLLQGSVEHFVGNIEGDQLFDGSVDIAIAPGIIGNIVLKACESLAGKLFSALREEFRGEEAVLRTLASVASRHDPDSHGASRLLGTRGLVLIGHGKARSAAIQGALRSAEAEIRLGLQPMLLTKLASLTHTES